MEVVKFLLLIFLIVALAKVVLTVFLAALFSGMGGWCLIFIVILVMGVCASL